MQQPTNNKSQQNRKIALRFMQMIKQNESEVLEVFLSLAQIQNLPNDNQIQRKKRFYQSRKIKILTSFIEDAPPGQLTLDIEFEDFYMKFYNWLEKKKFNYQIQEKAPQSSQKKLTEQQQMDKRAKEFLQRHNNQARMKAAANQQKSQLPKPKQGKPQSANYSQPIGSQPQSQPNFNSQPQQQQSRFQQQSNYQAQPKTKPNPPPVNNYTSSVQNFPEPYQNPQPSSSSARNQTSHFAITGQTMGSTSTTQRPIPPSLNIQNPNANTGISKSPIKLNQSPRPVQEIERPANRDRERQKQKEREREREKDRGTLLAQQTYNSARSSASPLQNTSVVAPPATSYGNIPYFQRSQPTKEELLKKAIVKISEMYEYPEKRKRIYEEFQAQLQKLDAYEHPERVGQFQFPYRERQRQRQRRS